jgi:hypothetical protein
MHEKPLLFYKYTPLDTYGTIFTKSGQEPTFSANSLQTAMWAHILALARFW